MQSVIRICLAVGLLVASASSSWADDAALADPHDAKAVAQLEQANRLYAVRKFDEAAKGYVAGALIEPAPVFDYNLGQCYRLLGRYQDAIWHYKRFLNKGQPGPELRGFVEGFIAQMEAELAKKASTQPPTEAAGSTRDANTVDTQMPIKPATVQDVQTPPAQQPTETDAESASMFTTRRKIALGAWAVGAVAVGAAVTYEVRARSAYDDAKAETTNQARRDAFYDTAIDRRHTAIVLGGVGAAALVAGTVLWITGKPDERAYAVAPHVGRDVSGVVFSGRF